MPTTINLFLTNSQSLLMHSCASKTEIADYHKMVNTFLKQLFLEEKVNSLLTDVSRNLNNSNKKTP